MRENYYSTDNLQLKINQPQSVVHEKPTIYLTNGKKYVACYFCNKNILATSWQRHARSHDSTKRYSCHVCGLGFNDKGNLSRHTQALHKNHRPHACHVCNKKFYRKSHLQDHLESHSTNRNYVCDTCGKASKSSTALRMHKKMHEESFKFHCLFCDARFKRKNQLIAHVSVHTGEKAHVCECGKAFRLRSQLNVHARTHTAINKNEKFNNNQEIVIQILESNDCLSDGTEPAKICDYCNTKHPEIQYKEHLISTHSELLFHCDECDNYVDRKDFIVHMSQHADEYAAENDENELISEVKETTQIKDTKENIEITKCELTDVEPDKTRDDIEINDTNVCQSDANIEDSQDNDFSDHSDAEYFCELPKSVFEAIEDSQDTQCENVEQASQNDTSESLDDRNKTSEENISQSPILAKKTDSKKVKKERTCPICFKVYTVSSSYFYHLKYSHKNNRDHECDVCGKKFSAKPTLAQHLLIHTGDCPYECKQCGKKFRARASLYIHEQTHVGLKTHSCTECHKSFRWRAHLERHRKRHEARKAHVCATCGRGFSVRCDLLRHARTHTAGMYECAQCGLTFAQSRYMKTHILKKHSF